MKKNERVLKVTLCGPGDVSKELELAENVINEWNQINWDATGWGLKKQYWRTSSTPDLSERAQQIINHQLIDDSNLVVAIFWKRLGKPTGLAPSGTVEEIDRAFHRGIRTMVYFSNLEAPKMDVDTQQLRELETFRSRVFETGLASSFGSRRQFENDFRNHLGRAVNEIITKIDNKKSKPPRAEKKQIIQKGINNIQVVGDGNTIKPLMPSKPKIVIPQAPGQVTPSEQKRITDLVHDLADLSSSITGKSEGSSRAEMRSRFLNHFDVPRYNALMSTEMVAVEAWYRAVKGSLVRSPKSKRAGLSDATWTKAIKTKMGAMGRTNDDYYPEIAVRLKIPKFTSLKQLSAKQLEKVYNLVMYDSKKGR